MPTRCPRPLLFALLGGLVATGVGFIACGGGGNATQGDAAGFAVQPGDVLHFLNRSPLDSLETLRKLLAGLKPMDPVVLSIERDGQLNCIAFDNPE